MLFPQSAIDGLKDLSFASMQDSCRIYTPAQADGFGETASSDTDHYDGACSVQDGRAAVVRSRAGDASLDASAVVRVPLTATGFDQDDVKVEVSYGSESATVTRTGTIEEMRRGQIGIWLYVKWEGL